MLDWTSGGILIRLVLVIGVLLYFALQQNRWKHIGAMRGYSLFLVALTLLAISQTLELYQALSSDLTWIVWQESILILAFFTFLLFVVFTAIDGDRLLDSQSKTRQRERWLVKVYEHVPAAVAVVSDGHLEYTNKSFRKLQKLYDKNNPFAHIPYIHKGHQEVTLRATKNKTYSYWLAQYPIVENEGTILIITDITEIKDQSTFIHNIADKLGEKDSNILDVIMDTLATYLPSSRIYVASYEEEGTSLQYLAYRGKQENVTIERYYDVKSSPFKYPNQWYWFEGSDLQGLADDPFVKFFQPERLGGVKLCGHDGQVIGLIIILQEKRRHIDRIILDFLSIFSHRVRAEIEFLRYQQLIQDSEERYKAFISRSREAIAHLDLQPPIDIKSPLETQWEHLYSNCLLKESNLAFDLLFEVKDHENIQSLLDVKSLKHVIRYTLESGYGTETMDVAHESQDGEIKWLSCAVMASIEDGYLSRLWVIIRDVTESRTHIQHLEHQAQHDTLTGLPNRIALRNNVDEKIEQASQFGFQMALLLIDLDRFKEINDALGHHYGDVLLKKVAPRIKPLLSPYRAFLARLGGDEFAVLMPSLQNKKEAVLLANSIMAQLREPFDLGHLNVEIAGSVGVSFYPEHGKDTSTLLRCADVAMYKAKGSGSDVLTYHQDLDDHNPRRLAVMTALRQAIRDDQLFLVFQPKVNLKDQRIKGAEALIRWQHPEHGLMPPAEFIPLAEVTDLIVPITEWVIDKAVEHIAQWKKLGVELTVAVNVSTRNLLDENFLTVVANCLEKHQVSPNLLEVEITESALMVDPERALGVLRSLNALGISLSVDDFGTGYSSLAYLKQLPINCLKIDITFVRHMLRNAQDEIIVNSIVNLAHNLSLTVVAEGVEDVMTLQRLSEMGCDHAQGFFISAPVEAQHLLDFIERWHAKLSSPSLN